MVDRICISINNRCNLSCKYCHFHEKSNYIEPTNMDVFVILDNVRKHIEKYNLKSFKIGFVGNGEPLLEYDLLKKYILYISDLIEEGIVKPYTITNGLLIDKDNLLFFKEHKVNVGFSIDGYKGLHNKYRCNSFDKVINAIELFYSIHNEYPSMNCTVGHETLSSSAEVISFFEKFNTRITFSRMIGKYGISLAEFHQFMELAKTKLNVRTGGYDCTMYGGLCGAGINNLFFSNGKIYLCGNCIDKVSVPYDTDLDEVKFEIKEFNRARCYRESCL